MPDAPSDAVLDATGVAKRFGAVQALKNASRYILTEVGTPIPLGSIYAYFGRSDRVHNYYPHPDFSFLYYKDIWMTPES